MSDKNSCIQCYLGKSKAQRTRSLYVVVIVNVFLSLGVYIKLRGKYTAKKWIRAKYTSKIQSFKTSLREAMFISVQH